MLFIFSEKQQLLSVEDYGDTMAAVQGLLKKHDAFETDFAAHRDRCLDICNEGDGLLSDGNHHSESIQQRCQQLKVTLVVLYTWLNELKFNQQIMHANNILYFFEKFKSSCKRPSPNIKWFLLQNKLDHLSELAQRRKTKLLDNSAYLQFMWKADVVESWIADKETQTRVEEFGRDLSTVQTLLTKQETFEAG